MTGEHVVHAAAPPAPALLLVSLMALAVAAVLAGPLAHPTAPAGPLRLERGVNPNEASLAQLLCLPGIGPRRAQTILDYRRRHGGPATAVFTRVEDLEAVPGLGPVTVGRLAPWLRFGRTPPAGGEKDLEASGDSIIMPAVSR